MYWDLTQRREERKGSAKKNIQSRIYPPPRSLVEQLDELFQGVRASVFQETPITRLAARLEPWLEAAAEGAPVALLPFAIEIH